jgi:hypothetical protein
MRFGLDAEPAEPHRGGAQLTGPTFAGASAIDGGSGLTDAAVDSSDLDDEYGASQAGSSDVPDVVSGLLGEGVRRIAVEIRNSLHYHSIHGGEQGAARVRVSGAMTLIPGLVQALGTELELELEPAVVQGARPGVFDDVPAERLAVAAGLAVTEMPA